MTNDPRRSAVHFDAYTDQNSIIGDPTEVESVVRKLSDLAGMRLLRLTTTSIEYELMRLGHPVFTDEGGYSVVGLISTSHITLHAWPFRSFFMFDMVSCRPFLVPLITDHLMRRMSVDRVVYSSVSSDEH